MSESLASSLPLQDDAEQHSTISTETTPGGSETALWVVVATGLNPAEATVIKSRLESESILAMTQQEAVGMVLGLTVGALGSAQVLVPEDQADQALEILSKTFEVDDDHSEI